MEFQLQPNNTGRHLRYHRALADGISVSPTSLAPLSDTQTLGWSIQTSAVTLGWSWPSIG